MRAYPILLTDRFFEIMILAQFELMETGLGGLPWVVIRLIPNKNQTHSVIALGANRTPIPRHLYTIGPMEKEHFAH